MQQRNSKPVIIGIAGRSASGKSTIAQLLAKSKIPVICQDWYYKTPSVRTEHNWDAPDAFDEQLIIDALEWWQQGHGVMTPRHDYVKCEMIPNVEFVEACPVLIFEGLYAIRVLNQCTGGPVYKIYIDCDADVALSRRLKRDVSERDRSVESVLDQYEKFVKPMHDKFVCTQRAQADLVIPNNVTATSAIEMITPFIRSLY